MQYETSTRFAIFTYEIPTVRINDEGPASNIDTEG